MITDIHAFVILLVSLTVSTEISGHEFRNGNSATKLTMKATDTSRRTVEASDENLDKCIFDDIRPKHTHRTWVDYGSLSTRHKRGVETGSIFQPIRIRPVFHNIDQELTDVEQTNLRMIVNNAVYKITHLFSVVPVRGPLVLSRETSCRSVFTHGKNAGRCGRKEPFYRGEKCAKDVDDFRIPESHLEALNIYNRTYGAPIEQAFPHGSGVADTDFILYIYSSTTNTCTTKHIIAYAVYCRMDQYGRPIAGFVNFCPDHLKPSLYNKDRAELTAIHELFHALGFSKDLFKSFQNCSISDFGLHCESWSEVIDVDTVNDVFHLVTPQVMSEAQQHFQCAEEKFGGTLDTKDGEYSSHWDPRMMYSSIMAPELGAGHLTFIDRITLAAFEDSGWYRVNYSMADSYTWGAGKGCEFGLVNQCTAKNSSYFCTRLKSLGCHYTHLDRGICDTDLFLSPCHVYKSSKENACTNGFHLKNKDDNHMEVYGEISRCFMSNVTKEDVKGAIELQGHCYMHRCLDKHTLHVKIGWRWYPCPSQHFIHVQEHAGVILCPQAELLCHNFQPELKVQTTNKPDVTDLPLNLLMSFNRSILDVGESVFLYNFRQVMSTLTGIESSRIVKTDMLEDSIKFYLLPGQAGEPMNLDVLHQLQAAIRNKTFIVGVYDESYSAVFIGHVEAESPVLPTMTPLSPLAICGIVFLVILVIFLVNVILLVKFHIITVPSFKRCKQKPEPESDICLNSTAEGNHVATCNGGMDTSYKLNSL